MLHRAPAANRTERVRGPSPQFVDKRGHSLKQQRISHPSMGPDGAGWSLPSRRMLAVIFSPSDKVRNRVVFGLVLGVRSTTNRPFPVRADGRWLFFHVTAVITVHSACGLCVFAEKTRTAAPPPHSTLTDGSKWSNQIAGRWW